MTYMAARHAQKPGRAGAGVCGNVRHPDGVTDGDVINIASSAKEGTCGKVFQSNGVIECADTWNKDEAHEKTKGAFMPFQKDACQINVTTHARDQTALLNFIAQERQALRRVCTETHEGDSSVSNVGLSDGVIEFKTREETKGASTTFQKDDVSVYKPGCLFSRAAPPATTVMQSESFETAGNTHEKDTGCSDGSKSNAAGLEMPADLAVWLERHERKHNTEARF